MLRFSISFQARLGRVDEVGDLLLLISGRAGESALIGECMLAGDIQEGDIQEGGLSQEGRFSYEEELSMDDDITIALHACTGYCFLHSFRRYLMHGDAAIPLSTNLDCMVNHF